MDVDNYTEQLDGLVKLLHAVGIDNVDNSELKRASFSLKKAGTGAAVVFPEEIGAKEARQLNDDQIEAMILKLQQGQAQAPQLMAALEEHAAERNGGKRTKKKGSKGSSSAPNPQAEFMQAYQRQTKKKLAYHHQHPPGHHQQPQHERSGHRRSEQSSHSKSGRHQHQLDHHGKQTPQPYQQQQPDHDDFDEEEDEDEFDEDADYPMVGPGVSDDISVVSDMTTPTVVSCLNVHDEERYEDIHDMPPMLIGGGGRGPPMVIQPPKRKNLIGGPTKNRPGVAAAAGVPMHVGQAAAPAQPRVGGAAAQRRKNYQETMARLQQNPYGMTMVGPAAALTPVSSEPFTPQFPIEEETGAAEAPMKKPPSRTKSGGQIEKEGPRRTGKTPSRTKSAGNKPIALTGDSTHSGTDLSYNTTPDNWMPFGETAGASSLDEGGGESMNGSRSVGKSTKKKSVKTKTTKGTKSGAKGTASKPATTTIDRDGFLLNSTDPFGFAPAPKKALGGDTMNGDGSIHSSESNGKPRKKNVKKKVVKKAVDGSGSVVDRESSSSRPKKTSSGRIAPSHSGDGARPNRRIAAPHH